MAVINHSAQVLLKAMSGHYVCTKDHMLGRLGNMLGKCPMSDCYSKL